MGHSHCQAYLSHAAKDKDLAQALLTHLASLKDRLYVRCASDIPLSADVQTALTQELAAAEQVLVLLSADYFASDELAPERDLIEARLRASPSHGIIPIRARPALILPDHPLAKLQGLPRDQKAITVHPDQDDVLSAIAKELQQHLEAGINDPQGSIDATQARRLFFHGEPLLHCNRNHQWAEINMAIQREGHELLLLPGAQDQAHEFFLARLERALPKDLLVCCVDWPKPQSLSRPPFPSNDTDFLDLLAKAVPGGGPLLSRLRDALRHQRVLVLHPIISRGHDDSALWSYYNKVMPELIKDLPQKNGLKFLQPLAWEAPQKSRRAAQKLIKSLLALKSPLPLALLELQPITEEDVVRFLTIIHYAKDARDPAKERRDLARYVCKGDASSEQVLRQLCRKLPEDLLR